MKDLIAKIVTSLIVIGISWLVLTTVDIKSEVNLINYKLEQFNVIVQKIYEDKADKQ